METNVYWLKLICCVFSNVSFLEVSKITGKIQMEPRPAKNGNTYVDIVYIKWKFTPTNMKMKFENLFNGDRSLGLLYN